MPAARRRCYLRSALRPTIPACHNYLRANTSKVGDALRLSAMFAKFCARRWLQSFDEFDVTSKRFNITQSAVDLGQGAPDQGALPTILHVLNCRSDVF